MNTAAAYTKAQLKEWVDFANAKHAVILYDAAYECFVSDGNLVCVVHIVREILLYLPHTLLSEHRRRALLYEQSTR